MPQTWVNALKNYNYPVNLSDFIKSKEFSEYFKLNIKGDRQSTVAFEDYFRMNAPLKIEVYFEAVFWKLYSQGKFRNDCTNRIIYFTKENSILPQNLWSSIKKFIDCRSIRNLKT